MKNIPDRAFGHPTGILGSLGGMLMARLTPLRNEWTVSLLPIHEDDRLLEVGFGPGALLQNLAAGAPKGFIAGVDTSPVMLRQATKRNAKAIQDGRMQLQSGSALELPFETASFDIALSTNSIQLWPDQQAGIREMQRVLKPGGTIAIVLQPVQAKQESEVREIGNELLSLLALAGFQQTRLEFKSMKPIASVCVLGTR